MSIARVGIPSVSCIINQNIAGMLRGDGKLSRSIKSSIDHIKRIYLSSDLLRIRYDETYEIGLIEFDSRRQTVIDIYNAFNSELRLLNERRGSMSRLNGKASLLVRLIAEMFSFEEARMIGMEYSEFASHKARHTGFLESLHGEFERIQEGRADMYDLSYLIGSWLADHLRGDDRVFRDFVVRADQGALPAGEGTD